MRRTVLVVVLIIGGLAQLAPQAQAEEITPLGWNTDGKFVVKVTGADEGDWGAAKGNFHAQCTPGTLDDKLSCVSCGDADADPTQTCGLASVPARGKALASSMTSPDKKLTLKQKVSCGENEVGDKNCATDILFGTLGYLGKFDDMYGSTQQKSKVGVYFRSDSKAVMVHFAFNQDGHREDEFHVVDVTDLHDRVDVPKLVQVLVAEQVLRLKSESDGAKDATDLYAADSLFFTDEAARGAIAPADLPAAVHAGATLTVSKVDVGVSSDGRAAWATFTATVKGETPWRVTELVVRDANGWRLAGGYWSRGMPDKDAHARAADGKLPAPKSVVDKDSDALPEDIKYTAETLRWSNQEWVDADDEKRGGFVSNRAESVLVGSAPKERGKAGQGFQKAWRGWVKGGMTVGKFRGGAIGMAGWMVVNVEVTKTKGKKTYTIPFRIWMIVELQNYESGGVILAHISVPQ